MKLVTSSIMQQIDREAIDAHGIPSLQLMENAGRSIAESVFDDFLADIDNPRVAIFCGNGNNGGDGFVIGRHLLGSEVEVTIYFIGPPDKMTSNARDNFDRLTELGAELIEVTDFDILPEELACDLIVDAIFGTGFAGKPRGMAADLIEYIVNQEIRVVAVDIPSGLNADSGQAEGEVVIADTTFTLAAPKLGLFLAPGRELAGDVELVPIGIPDGVIDGFNLTTALITAESVAGMLPIRKSDGHKSDFGRLLLVAGATGMTGAAELAARSTLRSGCGLARLACPKSLQPMLAGKLTEVMTHALPDVAKKGVLSMRALGEIRELVDQNDALVLGPGLGTHHETSELVRRLVAGLSCPAVIDADGLNALASDISIIGKCDAPLVLTPHPGEYKRLCGEDAPLDILKRAEAVRKFATDHNVVLVLKGSPTLVAAPGSDCYLNPTGNDGMATAGSGDVLSGVIGSFLAQGMTPLSAALGGVYVHGLAGDLACRQLTPRGMIAGDIINHLPSAFKSLA